MHVPECHEYVDLIELACVGVLLANQGATHDQDVALQRIAESTGARREAAIAAARALDVPMTPTGPLVESVPGRVY